jgi:hypothetical protein
MNTDIRVGDRFLIEMTVADPKLDWNGKAMCRVRAPAAAENWIVPHAVLLAGKRLPRAIRAGDRVRSGTSVHGHVVSISDAWAWVRWTDSPSSGAIIAVSGLTLCDEASS